MLLVGMHIGTVTTEKGIEVPPKTKRQYTPIILLGIYPNKTKQKHSFKKIHTPLCLPQNYSQQPRHGSNVSCEVSVNRQIRKM